MRIAMIGHKEFPSRAGGVEVVVYELATRLTARGVDVTVYNRGKEKHHNRYKELGVNVVRSFTPKNKSLNAMVYSFVATFQEIRYNSLPCNRSLRSACHRAYFRQENRRDDTRTQLEG